MNEPQNPLIALIRAMPPWAEFAVVITVAFAAFISGSLADAFYLPYGNILPAMSWTQFALYEIAIATTLGLFLLARGWRLADFGLDRPIRNDLGDAVLLLAAVYAVTLALAYVVPTESRAATNLPDTADVDIRLAAGFSLVNATFEEVFVCAYVVSAWRGTSMWNAITASAAIRLSYHLYQGPLAVAMIGPLGLIFGWFYATRGRLWPLIVAHAAEDFLFFLSHARL